LSLSKNGFINIHASLLPKWRGAAPIQRSLINMDKITGLSIMKINPKLDEGPVCNKYPLDILENENAKGLTDSKFIPVLYKEAFHNLHDKFTEWNNNEPLTENRASSKKLKRQRRMISIIKNSLQDKTKLKEFNDVIDMAYNLTEKKRFYISDYGYGNVRELICGDQDKLIRGQNWDKFYLENIMSWWKKKAGKRYDKLKAEGRFRDKVELWTEDDNIQIIR